MTNKLVVIINSLKIPKINKYFTIWNEISCTKLQLPPEPMTTGLPPPDPRSLCPLSSTEFVEPPPPPEQNSWVRHCVVGAGFWSSLEKSQATKGYGSWCNTVPNAKHIWIHQLCVAQASSATLAETLKSESSGRALSAATFNDATLPTPLSDTDKRAFTIVLSIPLQQREICVPVRSHVTENRVIRILSGQKIPGTAFHLVFSHWSLK